MQDLRLAHRIEYDVATNWKLVVQNYNECLHCPVIHPLLNRMHHYLGAENVPSAETYCGGAMGFKDGVETLSTDGKRRREFLPGLGGRDRELVNYFAIYPNFLLTLHPDYMMTITIWPQDAGARSSSPSGIFIPTRWRRRISCSRMRLISGIEPIARTGRSRSSRISGSARADISRGLYSEREKQLWEFDQFVLSRVQAHGNTETRNTSIVSCFVIPCFSELSEPAAYSSGRRCFRNNRRAFDSASFA